MRHGAVVTGAGRGIGAAVAVALAEAGYDLVLGDVGNPDLIDGLGYRLSTSDELDQVAERCRELAVRVEAVRCDVRDPEQVEALVARAEDLTVAVAVAGIMGPGRPTWELEPADLDRDLSVNLHGVANLARSAVPRLLPSGSRGRFVAVVSTAGERGLPLLGSYVAAKHAALGFVRALAADLGPHGVTANAVLPGSTRTRLLERTAEIYGLGSADDLAGHQRLGRLLAPEEVAATVRWLCSEDASAITGEAVHVDGGFIG